VELLAVLAKDSDDRVSERAQSTLLTQPLDAVVAAAGKAGADKRVFEYVADEMGEKPGIADALAANAACPTACVTRVARHLTPAGIQSLLDNLERLTSDTDLVDALKQLQSCTPEQRDLIEDLHGGEMAPKDIEEAASAPAAEPAEKEKRLTLLQRLAKMNVVQRIQLAVKGGREERSLLIRDSNKVVQRGVLQSPRLTDTEVEAFAAMANLTGEVLRQISMSRPFMKNYVVAKNLVRNPKTPLDVSLHLLPRMTATDLKLLTTNKNIPDTLRSAAVKLNRQRSVSRPS
jgi:hypothetical protein